MMNLEKEICKAFNAHAHEYPNVAKIQQEIGMRLFERLSYLKIEPQNILDLGCGPGIFTKQLKKHYTSAKVVGVDIAHQMLKTAKRKQRKWRTPSWVNADMLQLPFQDAQFDLIFSNQAIHWASSLNKVFCEINRVLRPGGCVMFSTLGPDTFLELRQAFQQADSRAHVNDFCDMHDVGDYLMAEAFVDPVVDMENIIALYPSLTTLLKALKAQGVRNVHANRNPGLTGKKTWSIFEQSMSKYHTDDNKIPLTYEVIYGHAWKGLQRRTPHGTEAYFPIDQLRSSRSVR